MAEIAVGSVIDNQFPLLTEEVKLLRGVHKEVSQIKRELKSIQYVLKEADTRAAKEEDVKAWVKELREVAFRMEDVGDEYLRDVAKHPHYHGFTGFLRKIHHSIKKLKLRHEIAREIQGIKASVQKIKGRKDRYGFTTSSEQESSSTGVRNVRWNDPRMTSLFLEEADVVGFETPRKELIGWLVDEERNRPPFHRTVISVVGMGGLGKTTLAKQVYDHPNVKTHFDCHAWISVSQSYKTNDLLKSMIEQFCKARKEFSPEGIGTEKNESPIVLVREYLQDKRYVVVFDDVWKIDFWREIEHAYLILRMGVEF